MRKRREFVERHFFGEAADRVVARMDLHQQRGSRADGFVVILQMRAVRRADFAQPGARAAHDVGNAKRAADLDQFAARHDHFLLRRQRGQREQHRGRVVVDDGGGFGAGQFADEVVDQVVAVAALPVARSNSRFAGRVSASTTACTASSGSSARPRFVCRTVPVRLKTLRNPAAFALRAAPRPPIARAGLRRAPRPGRGPPAHRGASRRECARSAASACVRPYCATSGAIPADAITRSTDGTRAISDFNSNWLLRSLDVPRFVHTRCERLFQVLIFAGLFRPEPRMRRRPPITLLAHQQIEREACEIVGERLEIVGLV